jgi:arylsulfatase K
MKRLLVLLCTVSAIICSADPVASGSSSVEVAKSEKRKNICLIQFDSWDGRVLGSMGHAAVKNATPNCDRLARQGVLFRNAYCGHPICCPSRANMWSGKYTHHVESWDNYKGLEPGEPTFKDRLEKVGYRFASGEGGIGKHDYRSGGHSQLARITGLAATANISLPFFRPEAPRIIESQEKRVHKHDWELVDQACAWLTQNAHGEQPFFLYVSIGIPHPAFVTSRYWLSRIDTDAVTIPPADDEDHPVMHFQRVAKNWQHGFDDNTVRRTRAIYYAMCAEGDAMVGQLLDKLSALGLDAETYVILISDHGENNMEHRQWYKMNMYESSVRVPFIVAGPGLLRGAAIDNVVSLIDLYPTLMDMGRTAGPDGLDGESLMPLLTGRTTRSRNWALALFTGCSANTSMFMLRQGDWKYVAYPGYKPQLFNLRDDPDEVHNLADRRAEVTGNMDRQLRSIVDYDEVNGRWVRYCKSAFRQWRDQIKTHPVKLKEYGSDITAANYEQIMANTYIGWNDDWAKKVEDWLAR